MAVALLATSAAPDAWPSFRNGPGNTGVAPVAVRGLNPAAKPWAATAQGLIWGTAVVDGAGNSYVGAADKQFYALDPKGKVRWTYSIFDRADAVIDSAAVLHPSGLVIVPGGDGYLHALDQRTGSLRWVFAARASAEHRKGVVVNSFEGNVQVGPDGTIYAGSDNGNLYAIGPDGKEKWRFQTGMMIWSSPGFDAQNRWLAFGSLDGHLYLLDPATGKLFDRFVAGGEVKASPAVADQQLFFGTANGTFYGGDVVAKADGFAFRPRWTAPWGDEIYASAALFGGRAIVAGMDGKVRAYDQATGREAWTYTTGSRVAASPVVSKDGVVLFGARNGKLYGLDATTGQRVFSYETTDARVRANLDASVALRADGTIVVGAYDGRIHGIPAGYAAKHGATGGWTDPEPPTPREAAGQVGLRVQDRRGRFFKAPMQRVGLAETLRLRLVGDGTKDLALQPDVTVTADPPLPLDVTVSADGRTVNVTPLGFYKPATRYNLTVTGRYRERRTNWLWDRWWPSPGGPLQAEVAFTSGPGGTRSLPTSPMGVRKLFLFQPEALETYTPAALEGQAFVMSPFDRQGERFRMLGLPAMPSGAGVRIMAEPSKVFLMEATTSNGWLHATGRFGLAAMGGTIPFSRFDCAARLDANGQLADGDFTALADLLGIRGNGASFSFPTTLINEVADHRLRLVAQGTFDGCPAPTTDVPTLSGLPKQARDGRWVVTPSASRRGEHLLVAVGTRSGVGPDGATIAAMPAVATAGQPWTLDLGRKDWDTLWLFWDGQALGNWGRNEL